MIKMVDNKLEITEVIPESTKVSSLALDELYTILQQHQAAQESWVKVHDDAQTNIDLKQLDIDKYTELIRQAKELGLKTEAELAEVEVKPEEPKAEGEI